MSKVCTGTTLLPPNSVPPYDDINHIIYKMWDEYLEIEFTNKERSQVVLQHLELTAGIIDYWEEKLSEVNVDEIRRRRSSCD
jgi:hypothetical protein